MIVSWASLFRTTRAAMGLLFLTATALILPPQTADMLEGMSFGGTDFLTFQLLLFLMALSAWHWARAALSARFSIDDARPSRAALALRANNPVDLVAFNLVPRIYFLSVACIGLVASVRSAHWEHAIATVCWACAGLVALQHRLDLQQRLTGSQNLTRAASQPRRAPAWLPGWLAKFWQTVDVLLQHAPFGIYFASLLLGLGFLFLSAGAIETFFCGTMHLADWLGRIFQGPSAALICLGLSIGPLTVLTFFSDLFRWQGNFQGISWGFRRPPVLILLTVLALLTPRWIALHEVRTIEDGPSLHLAQRQSLETIFENWRTTCTHGKSYRPIIVAISGGASRAGLWGARVLTEVDGLAARSGTSIFAISSVSGGSVGAATYLALRSSQATQIDQNGCVLDAGAQKVDREIMYEASRGDALGPLLAGTLFGDVPRALFGIPYFLVKWPFAMASSVGSASGLSEAFREAGKKASPPRGGDRAEALERAFEWNWAKAVQPMKQSDGVNRPPLFSDPFLSLFYLRGNWRSGIPIWIANGTDAQGGGRILTVPFSSPSKTSDGDSPAAFHSWPFLGALDAIALLKADVPISTAISNTARFPYLSPQGALTPLEPKEDIGTKEVIDGGYFENEGMQTALELARWLKVYGANHRDARGAPSPLDIEPILIQVTADADKGISEKEIPRCRTEFEDEPGSAKEQSRSVEFLAPLKGLNAVRGGHSAAALREAAQEFCRQDKNQSFFHFYLYRPCTDLPLNWVLSKDTATYIWDEALKAEGNAVERGKLEKILIDGDSKGTMPGE